MGIKVKHDNSVPGIILQIYVYIYMIKILWHNKLDYSIFKFTHMGPEQNGHHFADIFKCIF